MENTFLNITGITGKCDIYINDKIIDTDFSGDLKKRLGRDCFGDSGCISLIFKTNGDEYGVLGEAYISFE